MAFGGMNTEDRKRISQALNDSNIEKERKQMFCEGFGYGVEYGYTGSMPQGEIDTSSTFILAGMLYDKLEKLEEMRDGSTR